MKNVLWVLLYCISLTSAGQAASSPPDFSTYYYQRKTLFEQLPNTDSEIIFLGNSITDGGEWSELFADTRVKNRGISGDVTDGVLYRMDEVLESKPAKIFIMIGTNDLARGRTEAEIVMNYNKILDRITKESPETKVFIQSILPVNDTFGLFQNHTNKSDEIRQINLELRDLALNGNYTFIDLDPVFTNEQGQLKAEYTNDGLHLTGPGYMAWKLVIDPYLKK